MVIKVTERQRSDGEVSYKLDSNCQACPQFLKLAKIMLTRAIRKHCKYFSCCRVYDETADLSAEQMSHFLELLR